jgi:hypothetical protein
MKAGILYPGFLSGLLVFLIAWQMGRFGKILGLGLRICCIDLLYH